MSTDYSHAGGEPPRNALMRYMARFEEGRIIRAAFYGMLIGTVGVLAVDLSELVERNGGMWPSEQASTAVTVPVLPPAVEQDGATQRGRDPRDFITTPDDGLKAAMKFELRTGGILHAQGSIGAGSAAALAREVEERGEYVRTISLDSPGGSLDDAMQMARLIREKGFTTRVDDGALCASSCPLVLAGGAQRSVGEKAAIGLHQFYAVGGDTMRPEQALADAQMTTARISRFLTDMEVDPALWLHALDTPPRALYYLTLDEMSGYRLVTGNATLAATSSGAVAR